MKELIRKILKEYLHEERVIWTDDALRDITSKYDNFTDFLKKEKKVVSVLRRRGLFDELTKDMLRSQRIPYTDDEIEREARKYTNQTEFAKGSPNHYDAYKRRKLQDKFRHFLPLKNIRWTDEMLRDEAAKYTTIRDFVNNSGSAYKTAYSRGILDKITQHIDKTKIWTYDEVMDEIKNYDSYRDFYLNSPAFYQAKKNDWIDDIQKILPIKITNWTKDLAQKEALKYNTKVEFKKNSPKAYSAAHTHGWLDDITTHMEVLGSKFRRMVYVYEFPDNHAYIGLTYHKKRRDSSHMDVESLKSPVAKHMLKTGLKPRYKEVSTYIDYKDAQNLENCTMDVYKNSGWTLLNKQKGGGLGACKRTNLTIEIIRDLASQYPTRVEFKRAHSAEYAIAQKYGWLKDVFANIPKQDRTKWTYDAVKELAKQTKTRSELKYLNQSAYQQARINGWLDELFPQTYEYQQKLKAGEIKKKN